MMACHHRQPHAVVLETAERNRRERKEQFALLIWSRVHRWETANARQFHDWQTAQILAREAATEASNMVFAEPLPWALTRKRKIGRGESA
jgi:hypothetical protein